MARINVEDSLFKDSRFIDLILEVKDKWTALGMVVDAWYIAQDFYLNQETSRMIPLREWKKRKGPDKLIEVGLAELRGEFVYVAGSNDQFQWLIARQENGKKGGRPRKDVSDEKATETYSFKKPPEKKLQVRAGTESNPLSLSLSQKEKEKEEDSLNDQTQRITVETDSALSSEEISRKFSGIMDELAGIQTKTVILSPKKKTGGMGTGPPAKNVKEPRNEGHAAIQMHDEAPPGTGRGDAAPEAGMVAQQVGPGRRGLDHEEGHGGRPGEMSSQHGRGLQ